MALMKETVITKKGQSLMGKLLANEAEASFTKISISNKEYMYEELEHLTIIEGVQQTEVPHAIERIGADAVKVSAIFSNNQITTGYHARTVALYATDPDEGEVLYSVTIAEEADYMPAKSDVTDTSINFELIISVANSLNVSVEVGPAGYATIRDIEKLEREQENHLEEEVSRGEVHGMRVNPTTNRLEFKSGEDWEAIHFDEEGLRDNPNLKLRLQVSATVPPVEDGRIYYNSTDKLFYIGRDSQWWRLYVAGDEKLEQEPPSEPPALEGRTDTTIKLVADEDLEYRFDGGDWQESSFFSGLSRNTEYTFYSRFKEDDVQKASSESPAAGYTTDKGTQVAPSAPTVSNIEATSALVSSVAGAEVKINNGAWQNAPHNFTNLDEGSSYTAYSRRKETDTHYASPVSSGRTFVTPSSAPGPSNLIGGTMQAGFFGEVPASELFTASQIASAVGITQGTAQHENEPWLKFAYEGKILFRPRKAIRHSVSWDAINTAKCVYGGSDGKIVTKDGKQYRVRLMRGALTDPSKNNDADRGAKGSEWNKLMLPIHEQSIDKSWAYQAYVEENVPIWAHNLGTGANGMYSDADLMTHNTHGNGSRVWQQETASSNASIRVNRGIYGVSYSYWYTSSATLAHYGWAPVLELL